MPGPHRRLLKHISSVANIRCYVMSRSPTHSVNRAFNNAVGSLGALRDRHIQIVSRYIINPSRSVVSQPLTLALICPVNPLVARNIQELKGTGGTQLISFLKQSRDETKCALSPV